MSKLVHNNQILEERRRELRKNQTKTEEILWWYLRGQKLGVKFKRQHSIGGYILDFYCPEKKLIIELDGEVHNTKEAREYDEVRDKYFRELDYKILRFENREVENDIEKVLEKIEKETC
ncbi:MAG: endonuclease domain-containing protein [Patescibacteria group bacterium]